MVFLPKNFKSTWSQLNTWWKELNGLNFLKAWLLRAGIQQNVIYSFIWETITLHLGLGSPFVFIREIPLETAGLELSPWMLCTLCSTPAQSLTIAIRNRNSSKTNQKVIQAKLGGCDLKFEGIMDSCHVRLRSNKSCLGKCLRKKHC